MQKSKKQYESLLSLRAYLVDTSARIIFYVPIIAVWEIFMTSMSADTIIRSRAIAVISNFFLGRYHGKVREFFSRITNTGENSPVARKQAVDILTGGFVGVTSYALIIWLAGATVEQAQQSVPFVLVFSSLTGGVFGKFADWWRHKWGTTPVYEKKG